MQCQAWVTVGTYSYTARNVSRQCLNLAKDGSAFCKVHQQHVVTATDRANFNTLRNNLMGT